jgi:hypothetical protein
VVSEGSVATNRPFCEEHGLVDLLLQKRSEVYDAYEARGTPSAVIVDPSGKIASATVMGQVPIEELIRATLRGAESWQQPSLMT